MIFSKRRANKGKTTDLTEKFILQMIVQDMRFGKLLLSKEDPRNAVILDLYSEKPIMLNGETEHLFRIQIPNYHTAPQFNLNRIKFWLCNGHKPPIIVTDDDELQVPLIDEETCKYFKGRTMYLTAQIFKIGNGQEYIELYYALRNKY